MVSPAGPSFLDQFRRKPLPQLFVCFRGELRNKFVSHLVKALKDAGVNVFIDSHELRGRHILLLLRRIETSLVALVIFSKRFAETEWPLHEVVKIAERVRDGELRAIPVFYGVSPEDVRMFDGKFGDCFVETVEKRGEDHPLCQRWENSVRFIAGLTGFTSEVHSIDANLVEEIVKSIKEQLPYRSPAKLALQQKILREFFLATIVSLIGDILSTSFFIVKTFFTSLQWYLAVLILFVVRQIFCFFESFFFGKMLY